MRRALLAIILTALSPAAQAQNELHDVGCGGEARLHSVDSVKSTEVIFFNQSTVPIRTYWLDFEGKRIFRSEIRPGDSFVQQTYVTHPWVVTNSSTRDCVAIFQPDSSAAIVVVH
jgi:hypothetical protein